MSTPKFWENNLEAIEQAALSVKRGRCSILTKSQGGRDIYLIEYGEKQNLKRQANYMSALHYGDAAVYADKTNAKPVLLIAGATHGGEIEGVAALLNLIAELETGRDLRGCSHGWVSDLASNYRLLLIPCLNPDGRARVPFSIVPDDPKLAVYYKHGEWKNGTPADYNSGFRVHPITDAVSHMGGYYNDAGINLYVDNFFAPMAEENKALFSLVDEEAPDFALFLHTGCHKHAKLLQPYYIPGFVAECVMDFDERLCEAIENSGYTYYSLREHMGYGARSSGDNLYPPLHFPMESAVFFSCGALSLVYESNEASPATDNPFYLENILNCHFILFEQAVRYAREFQQKCLRASKA